MARRLSPQRFSRGVKRAVDWDLSFSSIARTNIPAGTKVLLGSITAAALDGVAPATIVRTRGVLNVLSDQSAATEDQMGAIGLAFVNEVARALGVTGLPGPDSDFGYDWFWWQGVAQTQRLATAVGFENAGVQYVIDSKAMRKFDGGSGLVLMVENVGSTGFDVSVQIRILIKAG